MQFTVTINKRAITGLLVWGAWFFTLLVNLSLTIGSYRELEPEAGKMFGFITLGWALMSVFIWLWRRNSRNLAQK